MTVCSAGAGTTESERPAWTRSAPADIPDVGERVDSRQHVLDVVAELFRCGVDVLGDGNRSGGHQHGCADSLVDARHDRRQPAAEAPADEPEPLVVDPVVVGEQIERAPRRDDVRRRPCRAATATSSRASRLQAGTSHATAR